MWNKIGISIDHKHRFKDGLTQLWDQPLSKMGSQIHDYLWVNMMRHGLRDYSLARYYDQIVHRLYGIVNVD